ncbi:MAG: DUF3365 domain-containing protein [Planctomycetaceae bacterium]|nr:DUF3365 domain-containing protein [Planctomycetaceae bacterium]
MKRFTLGLICATVSLSFGLTPAGDPAAHSAERNAPESSAADKCETVPGGALPTAGEARGRALLLHESFEAMLHATHHYFYREDEGLPLPAVTMKEVFREIEDRRQVQLRWLAVDGQAMNVAHLPQDKFEREAVAALSKGDETYDHVENGMYRYVGMICLTNECLKCHLPNRKSTENRSAGIAITMKIDDSAKALLGAK